MEWKSIKVYECPECGEWVRDMDDACNHKCKHKQASEEMEKILKIYSEIDALKKELKSIPFYNLSKRKERKDIKFRIWELEGKILYGHFYPDSKCVRLLAIGIILSAF